MESLFEKKSPIAVLIATEMEFAAFIEIASKAADVVMEIKKSTMTARSFDCHETKVSAPFDKIYKLIIGRQEVIVVHTSESIRRASRAVDYVSWCHGAKLIINFGTAGALKSNVEKTGIYLAKRIVQSDFDISGGLSAEEAKKLEQPYYVPGQHSNYPEPYIDTNQDLCNWVISHNPTIQYASIASGNKFVFGQEKQNILDKFDADIVDMEAVGILLTANEENIPTIIFKCISDGVDDSAETYYKDAANVSEACSGVIVDLIQKM